MCHCFFTAEEEARGKEMKRRGEGKRDARERREFRFSLASSDIVFVRTYVQIHFIVGDSMGDITYQYPRPPTYYYRCY